MAHVEEVAEVMMKMMRSILVKTAWISILLSQTMEPKSTIQMRKKTKTVEVP